MTFERLRFLWPVVALLATSSGCSNAEGTGARDAGSKPQGPACAFPNSTAERELTLIREGLEAEAHRRPPGSTTPSFREREAQSQKETAWANDWLFARLFPDPSLEQRCRSRPAGLQCFYYANRNRLSFDGWECVVVDVKRGADLEFIGCGICGEEGRISYAVGVQRRFYAVTPTGTGAAGNPGPNAMDLHPGDKIRFGAFQFATPYERGPWRVLTFLPRDAAKPYSSVRSN